MAGHDEKIQLLTWFIGSQLFGMELYQCREVVQDRVITRVPHARDTVAGIVNLRGDVVTVLDLSVLLHYESGQAQEQTVVIRLKSDGEHVAVKADAIHDIVEVERGRMEGAPAHLSELEMKFVSGVIMTENGLVVILNAKEILKSS